MRNAVDEIAQPNIKRTPNYNGTKCQKAEEIYPKCSVECINKSITEKIKYDKKVVFHLAAFGFILFPTEPSYDHLPEDDCTKEYFSLLLFSQN